MGRAVSGTLFAFSGSEPAAISPPSENPSPSVSDNKGLVPVSFSSPSLRPSLSVSLIIGEVLSFNSWPSCTPSLSESGLLGLVSDMNSSEFLTPSLSGSAEGLSTSYFSSHQSGSPSSSSSVICEDKGLAPSAKALMNSSLITLSQMAISSMSPKYPFPPPFLPPMIRLPLPLGERFSPSQSSLPSR